MNIQLRDSQALQTAIYARVGKRPGTLPRAQLHPELLAGIVEGDRGGFEVRSEQMAGEHVGLPVPIDVENMAAFLPQADTCEAHWFVAEVKQGDALQRIPSELIFEFSRGGKLVIRTQTKADVDRLVSILPTDRRVKFDGVFNDGKITLIRAAGEKETPVVGRSVAQLMVEAARAGVPWDKSASVETMAERIAEAQMAKAVPAPTPAKSKKQPEPQTAGA